MNVWTNPDGAEGTTADKAVQAWYDQGKYFDPKTGKATDEKFNKEALEYVNVINKSTTKVGFAVRGPTVVGYYCPPASTDPKELMEDVPPKREPPVPPKLPEDLDI